MVLRLPRFLLALLATASLFAAVVLAQPVDARSGRIIDLDEQVDCNNQQLLGPDQISADHVTADDDIALDALVMVDFAKGQQIATMADPEERAAAEQKLFDEVRQKLVVGVQSYEPLDVNLRYDDWALLQPLNEDGTLRARTTNAREIIALAKAQLGGKRPDDVDVVYVATDLDIQIPGIGNIVAGLADCIGGVAHADRAFAVGEVGVLVPDEGGLRIGPVAFYKDFSAKVAAHEIGHLMGGHHHYQECGTAVAAAVPRGELGPCTLMTNAVDFQTIPFSNLNGAVVRGHAEAYAVGTDAPPPSQEEPPAEEEPPPGATP